MTSAWFLWMICLFFLVTPVSYGWGYRGWGPPYPRYIQRRRGAQAAAFPARSDAFDHHAWGIGGDILWLAFLIAAMWAVSRFFFWR